MTGLQRTLAFIAGQKVDREPFHPIIMRWAAKHAGVKYRDFVLEPAAKCSANIRCADDFDLDWVTVLSDPYAEASAFGIQVEYPEDNLPLDVGGHLPDLATVARLQPYRPLEHPRCVGRIREIKEYHRLVGDRLFIVGWIEGPVAEYADLRGVTNAALDLLDDPAAVSAAMDVIVACAKEFAAAQVQAGAQCIGIGDAFCSQIGPVLYRKFAFEREKKLVKFIHGLGAKVKLHICGNTDAIMADMIATGADTIDVDHLVPSMAPFVKHLRRHQVFSGKTDPVSVIQDGTAEQIAASVNDCRMQSNGRCIVSAGCEITPGTSDATMRAFRAAVK